MEIILSYKIRLAPSGKQSGYFSKACGIARFAWNRGYEEGLTPSGLSLKKKTGTKISYGNNGIGTKLV